MREQKRKLRLEQALWTGVEGNGFIHERDGSRGMRLTMCMRSTIATDLSSCECTYVSDMFVLPTLAQRLLNKKSEKGH